MENHVKVLGLAGVSIRIWVELLWVNMRSSKALHPTASQGRHTSRQRRLLVSSSRKQRRLHIAKVGYPSSENQVLKEPCGAPKRRGFHEFPGWPWGGSASQLDYPTTPTYPTLSTVPLGLLLPLGHKVGQPAFKGLRRGSFSLGR